MTATALPKCLTEFAHLIESVSDERGNGDGYWVYLVTGWTDPDGETHCIHEPSPAKCAREMKHVRKCKTPGCCH